tara:strand:+ start:1365 stop:2114 length:750 start_codon:yes stop_codon:yes gene_type:complete
MNADIKNYGGSEITSYKSHTKGRTNFADCSYVYFQELIDSNTSINIHELTSYTLFVLDIDSNGTLEINGQNQELKPGDSISVRNCELNYTCLGEKLRIIVSGVKSTNLIEKTYNITRKGKHYKVNKPWGHELWLNGEDQDYCLKEIFLKANNQTSLQYHHMKEETNILYQGKIQFVYQLEIESSETKYLDLTSISSIHVKPMSVHRIKAVTDVLLYETSTPHLKDVVRIEDDTNRSDGHIDSEHSNNKI